MAREKCDGHCESCLGPMFVLRLRDRERRYWAEFAITGVGGCDGLIRYTMRIQRQPGEELAPWAVSIPGGELFEDDPALRDWLNHK